MAMPMFDVCRAVPAAPLGTLAHHDQQPAQGLASLRAAPRPLTARRDAWFLRESRTTLESCGNKLASEYAGGWSKTARPDLFLPTCRPVVTDADAPPSYEDTLNDAPPDYTASDALATAKLNTLDSEVPPLYSAYPFTKPRSNGRTDEDSLRGELPSKPLVDFSTVDGVREHKGKKKKKQAMASWAKSDNEGENKDGDGGVGEAPNGDGGDNAAGGGAGGGGGGGDDNNGGDDKKDDDEDWNTAPAGKKAKKKATKKKNPFSMPDDEDEDEKTKEGEPPDEDGGGDAGVAMPGDDSTADTALVEANPNDEWGGWDTVSNKKSAKKGKNGAPDPAAPALPPAAKVDGGDMTFDSINLGNDAPKIDLSFGGADSKPSTNFGAFSWSASTMDWGLGSKNDKKTDAAKDAADASSTWGSFATGNKINTGFNFGFDGPVATEAKPEDEWGVWDTVSSKKDKKKGKTGANALAVEDPPIPVSEPVVEPPPPEPTAPPAETHPKDKCPGAGLALSKKDQKKAAKKAAQATAAAALIDQAPDPTPSTEPTPAEANPEDNSSANTGKKDKKKGKGKSVDPEQETTAPVVASPDDAPPPPPDLYASVFDDPALNDPALDDPALDDSALEDPAFYSPALDALDLDDAANDAQPELTEAQVTTTTTTTATPTEANADDEWGISVSKKYREKGKIIEPTPEPEPAPVVEAPTVPKPAAAEDKWGAWATVTKKDKKEKKGKGGETVKTTPVDILAAPKPPVDGQAQPLVTPVEANADDEWASPSSKKDKKKGKGEKSIEEPLPPAPVPPPAVTEPISYLNDRSFSSGTSKKDKKKKRGQQAATTGFDDVSMVQPDGVDEPNTTANNGDENATDGWSVGKRDKKKKSADKSGAADDVTHDDDPLATSADVQQPDGHADGEEEAPTGWGVWAFGIGKNNRKAKKGETVGASAWGFPPAPTPPGEMETIENHEQAAPPLQHPNPLAIEAPPPAEDAWVTMASTKKGKKSGKGKEVVEPTVEALPLVAKELERPNADKTKGKDITAEPTEMDGITEPAPDIAARDKKVEEKSTGWSLWGSSTTKKKTKKEPEKEKKEREKLEKKEKEAAEKAAREAEEKAAKEAEEQEALRKAEEEAEAARVAAEEEARIAEEEAKKKADEEAAVAKTSSLSKKDKRKQKKGAKDVAPVVEVPAPPAADPEHVPDPGVSDPLTADAPAPAAHDQPPAEGTGSTKTSAKLDRGDAWGASSSSAGGFWGVSLKKTKKGNDSKVTKTNSEAPAVLAADTGGVDAATTAGLGLSGADPFAGDGLGHDGSEWAWPDEVGGEAHVLLQPSGDPDPVPAPIAVAPESPGSERKPKKKSGTIADRLRAFEAPLPPVSPAAFAQDPNELLSQADVPPQPPEHELSLPPQTSAYEHAADNHEADVWGDAAAPPQNELKKSSKDKRAEKKAAKKAGKGQSASTAAEPPVIVPEPEPGSAAAVGGVDDLMSPIPGGFPEDDVEIPIAEVQPSPPVPIVEPEVLAKEKASPAKSKKEKERERKKKGKSGSKMDAAAPEPVVIDVPPPPPHNPAPEDCDQPPEQADPAINISDLPPSDVPPALQDENLPLTPPTAREVETKPAKSESSKKERPKVIRDKNAGTSWGFWGATVGPTAVRETVRKKKHTADADGGSATRTPVRGAMVRERRREKPVERDDSKSSGSVERKNSNSRPKPTARSSSFSFFGGATPMRSKSMREPTPRSSAKTRRHEEIFENEEQREEQPKVGSKAARIMGLGEGEQRSADRARLSRRHSTRETGSRRRSARVPAGYDEEDAARAEETSPHRSSRRKSRHADVAVDGENPPVIIDAQGAGPDFVMEDDAVFVERDGPAAPQSRRKREKKESRAETPNKSENSGGGGLMGLFGLGSAKKKEKENSTPEFDERDRRHGGIKEVEEGRRRKRSRAADEDYAKRLRREQRRIQRSRPGSEDELAPDTPAPAHGGGGETDPEEAEARRAERRARRERRKGKEVLEDRCAKEREQQEQRLREEQEMVARRLQEEKRARRAARKEKEERRRIEAEEERRRIEAEEEQRRIEAEEERRRIEAEEERKRIEAEEATAVERAELERERRERHARRRDRHGGGVSVDSPSAHHSSHRPRTDSRRHSTRMEDDRDREDRRRRHDERRARRTAAPDADADFKPSTLRRSHTEPVRDYFDPRNGTLHRLSSHRHHHHGGGGGGGGSGSAASGSDKTRSWVDQVNAEPPPPIPLAETIIDAPPAVLDAAAALNPGIGAYVDDMDRHELRRAHKRDSKFSDERDRFYDPAAAAAAGYDESGRRRRRRRRDDAEGFRSSDGGSGEGGGHRRKRDSDVLWDEPGVRTWDGQPAERPKGERKGSSWLKKIAGL